MYTDKDSNLISERFDHIWDKRMCGQGMQAACISLVVTLEVYFNLQIVQCSLQSDTYLWKIPLPHPPSQSRLCSPDQSGKGQLILPAL